MCTGLKEVFRRQSFHSRSLESRIVPMQITAALTSRFFRRPIFCQATRLPCASRVKYSTSRIGLLVARSSRPSELTAFRRASSACRMRASAASSTRFYKGEVAIVRKYLKNMWTLKTGLSARWMMRVSLFLVRVETRKLPNVALTRSFEAAVSHEL